MASEFISILDKDALKDLQTANIEIVKLITNIDKAGSNMQNIKIPSQGDGAIKNLNDTLIKSEKLYTSMQIQLERYAQAQNRTKISSNALEKSELSLTTAIERKEKALQREVSKLEASQNLYSKVQAKMNLLSNEYKNLATRKELGISLTQKEEQRYTFLQNKILTYDKTLKSVDATMGKYQRNVGNYASGFNPISNSINQLTRELPAFTYSMQTGFMAISNNIPIFTDAIGNAIKQNKLLQAEGKPTTNVLKQLAGAFFSWQTLMGVGITLLTVYGKEIGNFISSTFKSKSAVDGLKEAQKQLNDVSTQGAKNAVEETLKLKSLLAIAKDTTLTYKERMIAVKELQSTYPAYFDNLSTEKVLAGQTAEAERLLTDAILSRAKANAAVTKITENQALIIDIEIKRLELKKQLSGVNQQLEATEKRLQSSGNVTNSQGIALSQMYDKRKGIIKELNELSGEKHELDVINNTLTSFAIEKQKEAILLDYKEEKAKKGVTKAKREDLEAITLQSESTQGLLSKLVELRDGYVKLQADVTNTSDDWREFNKVIEYYNKLIESIKNPLSALQASADKGINEFLSKYQNATKAGLDETAGYWKEHGNEIIDLSQELVNTLAEISNQRFENQLLNLDKERNIAIAFAGESATAKEEIDRQYEERRAKIQRKQAEAQKKLAIFNIVTDTAQAIMASLIRDPTGTLAILIGAIGAAQLAVVASQEIPQFAKGTDNAPEGWAYTQEKGREIITDKSGKVKSLGNDKGAQLTYLNKGDKVFKNSETEKLMFDNNLNSMLIGNGIAMPKIEVNNDMSQITNEIKSLSRIVANKEGLTITKDAKGYSVYQRKQAETKKLMNNVLTYKGYDI
jgi:hypothetical protein